MTTLQNEIRVHAEVIDVLVAIDAEKALPGLVSELEATLEFIDAHIVTEVEHLSRIAEHLFVGASKLIRPVLALMCAAAAEGKSEWPQSARTMAAVVEIAHVATLYHDDVMDEAGSRRGLQSVNQAFGNKNAIVAGDLLLSRALELACGVGVEQSLLVSRTLRYLCEGQALEMRDQHDTGRSVEDYLASVCGKTAQLFAASCAAGAIEGGFAPAEVDAFATFGRALGMSFQIADDILDICSTEAAAGKPTMNDIREGVYSLPVVEAMRRNPELAEQIRAGAGTDWTRAELDALRGRILDTGALEHAKDVAAGYARDAVRALDAVQGAPAVLASLRAMARAMEPR